MQCYLVGDLDHCERPPQFSKLYSELPVHPCSFFQCSLGGSSVSPRAHRNRCWMAKLQEPGQVGANRRTVQGPMLGVVEVRRLSPLKAVVEIYLTSPSHLMKARSRQNASQRVDGNAISASEASYVRQKTPVLLNTEKAGLAG